MAVTFLTNEDEKKYVKTINDTAPDENGNIVVKGEGIAYDNTVSGIDATTVQGAIDKLSGGNVDLHIGPDKPTNGALYWLDTSEDIPVVPDVPDVPDVPEKTLTSISATYSGGDVAVGTAVTYLTGIVVTAHYSDGSTSTVTGYTLSGTIADGSNTITVSYGGKTTTFTVTGVAEEEPEDTGVYNIVDVATDTYDGVEANTSDGTWTTEEEIVSKFIAMDGSTVYRLAGVSAGDTLTTVKNNSADRLFVCLYTDGTCQKFMHNSSGITIGDFVDNYAGRLYSLVVPADCVAVYVTALAERLAVDKSRAQWIKAVS